MNVDALTEQLVAERMNNEKTLACAIDEIAGSSDHNNDGNTVFAAELARVLLASDAAFPAECVQFFDRLRDMAARTLRPDAETDAAAEAARFRADAEEMRDWYRRRRGDA